MLSYNLTELLNIREHFDEALPLAERTTAVMREVLGEDHPFVWLSESNRAQSLAGLGQGEEALALHETASAALTESMGLDHQFSLTARRQALESLKRLDPASVSRMEVQVLVDTHIDQTSRRPPRDPKGPSPAGRIELTLVRTPVRVIGNGRRRSNPETVIRRRRCPRHCRGRGQRSYCSGQRCHATNC